MVADRLRTLGYESLGEAGVAGRVYLRRRNHRWFNISLTTLRARLWRDNLLLRDYLRSDATARRRYAREKWAAVNAGNATLLAYGEAKSPVIDELLEDARTWRGRERRRT